MRNKNNSKIVVPLCLVIGLLCVLACQVQGSLLFSVYSDFKIDDAQYKQSDLVGYDLTTGEDSLYYTLTINKNLNAMDVLSNGNLVFSANSEFSFNGADYGTADLVEYDMATGQASLFFDGDLFDKKSDIDAVDVLDSGRILLSTDKNAKLGGLSFKEGDIIEYDPIDDIAVLIVSGDVFGKHKNINAMSSLDNGNFIFSAKSDATVNGIKYDKGQLFEYNLTDGRTSLYMDASKYGPQVNIDAVIGAQVPEPSTILLLSIGGLACFGPGFLRPRRLV
jgi:hypothetical protein